jgi:ABC-type sugar transport system substrate-binding protein
VFRPLRPLLALLLVALLAAVPVAAAQTASPTAVPTTPPEGDDPFPVTFVALLVGAFFGGGLLLAAAVGLVSLALVELVGPFGDRVHLVLPLLVVALPIAVLVNSTDATFFTLVYAGAVVGAALAGFLLRRRYR